MSEKHTPTPWVAGETIISSGTRSLAQMECVNLPFKANAEFICRAVNSHKALLEALKRYMAFDGRYGGQDGNPGEIMDEIDLNFNLRNLHKQAKEAISQAEVKP